jgi:hypothetical protein
MLHWILRSWHSPSLAVNTHFIIHLEAVHEYHAYEEVSTNKSHSNYFYM